MECAWDAALLQHGDELPPELLEIIRSGSNEQYLQAITQASLDARYTTLLFTHCENIYAHTCASLRRHGSLAASLATLGRIVPFAPCLQPFATRLLESESYDFNASDSQEDDLLYLLGLFRLLRSNNRVFKQHVDLVSMQSLLSHPSRPVVYMAIRILQICLDGADHWFECMVLEHLGEDTPQNDVTGQWDDKHIDYRFLTLWEDERYEKMSELQRDARRETVRSDRQLRVISDESFDPLTTPVGNVLFPYGQSARKVSEKFENLITTSTIAENIRMVAEALKSPQPMLLAGLPGSGKTMLVRHVAHRVGQLDRLVSLHLNEQSDAKLLMGIHTTGDTPGSFMWKPGVLTTAVQEGRWVLIEDLDRAPNEIIGTLLPLIERGELLIPNRKQTVHAAEGFRIIATVRSSVNTRGEETHPLVHMIGARHWHKTMITMPPLTEQMQIAQELFPSISQLLPQFMVVYERLQASRLRSVLVGKSKTGIMRAISPRDLLKWCNRVERLLMQRASFTSNDLDDILMEAVDCFAGALPEGSARTEIVLIIAEELQVNPQRRDYLMTDREVRYESNKQNLSIGRYIIPRTSKHRSADVLRGSFSTNPHTSRMLERVAAAVVNREPLLLVGETGVGKTTAVQHLANHLGKKLEPFNLSQQSEAGDLLGGFKPITARSLIVPLKDEFDELFQAGFSVSKNQQFLELLGTQMKKSNWRAVCKLWHQALKMVDQRKATSPDRQGEAPKKKRKVDAKTLDPVRWASFAAKVKDLERRLGTGTEAFAFSFMEGNIVKAVRNGDWVLLDEINLATPDTLEAIADLLDPAKPSLLLTEAGNIERIEAHPEFRIFAAMNPATDIGKKDLPPGIRSRFTELYVESPDKDLKSLQSIVRSYLRTETTADPAIAPDVGTLYQKILALAEQGRLVDGAGQKPHFSLRTLTRTLSFAKYIAPQCSMRRALYEGFQMSFLTFLDVESERLVDPLLERHLMAQRTNIRSELQKALRKPHGSHMYVQGYPGSKHWVRKGIADLEEQPHYILTPFIRRNLENLVRAASTRRFPVLIQGPTSSGKTSMIEYLAKRTGHKFVRINNHEHTDLQEYLGTYVSGTDGRLQYQEGILVQALREGHWIVLDELNLAPTDVLEALNRLLDDNRELLIPETQEVVRPHEDFMLFATQNPAGLYGGRKTLSRAFRNRFLELHFDDIPVDELQEILHRRTQLPESRCKRIVAVYRELSVLRQETRVFEQKSFATLRDLFRWALRPNDTIEQLANNGFMLLAERVRKSEERQALKTIIENAMSAKGPRVSVDESVLYAESSPELQQYSRSVKAPGVVWTRSMRRLYVLVSRAVQNNEPVLLVGETGCGKTTVCQMLAEALRKDMHMVNAHQNTETGDLIGSQRPVRGRDAVEIHLRNQLLDSPLLQALDTNVAHSTDALLHAYDGAVASLDIQEKATYVRSSVHRNIQAARTRFKALFEWADGSLVQAMKSGAFFLLDEISLADDSVLERINSVLESSRSILLAEKGSLDSFVTATPGFQFLATMNPGGDYGKRELSPALRNRFTEIWVPALSDTEDVMQIASARLALQVKKHATSIVTFAWWFQTRYNTSAVSAVSIRDVLAWVQFVNTFADLGVAGAVVHGAALVYIDTLGANPAGLMTLTGRNLEEERATCLLELSRIVGVDAAALYSAPIQVVKTSESFSIGPFRVQIGSAGSQSSHLFTFDAPTSRRNAMRVTRAMQLTKPVMLEGSPGVGKTALVTAIADAAGVALTRINLSEQTDLLDLFGSDAPVDGAAAGTFQWRDAPFLRAMKSGEWVLLDEMNLASQSVLEGLNACLDHRGEIFVPELGQSFSRHPEFRLFAAQNPHHQGGGRKGLPASFVNRFTVVYADAFGPDDLMLICQRSFPSVDAQTIKQAVRFVQQLDLEVVQYRRFGTNGGPWEFNLRDTSRWLGLVASEHGLLRSANAHDFVDFIFTQRFRSADDRISAERLLRSVFCEVLPRSELISSISSTDIQLGLASLPRNRLTMESQDNTVRFSKGEQLRICESVMLCVQQQWPVILTGPSGSGKTSLLSRLAATTGVPLVTIAMNAETDAMDLIGGYEQTDSMRQSLQALDQLRAYLVNLAKLSSTEQDRANALQVLAPLLRCGKSLPNRTTLEPVGALLSGEEHSAAVSLLSTVLQVTENIDKARFEWIDGLLVEALQQEKWLVLDNANLCSASVLDRLNSLLEPNGALIINEHAMVDGSPRVIRPHPGFRIFLTVDPRYGELSRAMRNRAVELFLLPREERENFLNPLVMESSMARFTQVKAIQTFNRDGSDASAALVMPDHLGLCDAPLIERLGSQLNAGLYSGISAAHLRRSQVIDQQVNAASPSVERLASLYKAAASQAHMSADFARVQTLHSLNNPSLVRQDQQIYLEALAVACMQDVETNMLPLAADLNLLKSNKSAMRHVQHLERSASLKIGAGHGSSGILTAVETFLGLTRQWAHGLQTTPADQLQHAKTTFCRLSALWKYLLQTTLSSHCDQAVLSAWLMAFRSAISKAKSSIVLGLHQLLDEMGQLSVSLEPHIHGVNGRAYGSMWRALKSATPRTLTQLNALLDLKKIAVRFGAALQISGYPLAEIASMRVSFARALDACTRGATDVAALIQELHALEAEVSGEDSPCQGPYFANVSDSICRRLALKLQDAALASPEDIAALEFFAERSVAQSTSMIAGSKPSAARDFAMLASALESSTAQSDLAVGDAEWSRQLLQRTISADDVSVANLQLLRVETAYLGQTVARQAQVLCTDGLKDLNSCLERLLEAVVGSLAASTEDPDLASLGSAVLGDLHRTGKQDAGQLSQQQYSSSTDLTWIRRLLFQVLEYVLNPDTEGRGVLHRAAAAWTSFACACLALYIPTQPCDPALKPIIERDAHRSSVLLLTDSLAGLRAFRQALTGESSSLRARALESDIECMGPEPKVEEVCRPDSSKLTQLQGEYDRLARVLRPVFEQVSAGECKSLNDSTLRNNLERIRTRFAEDYQVYADLTRPIVGFIDCLRMSQQLEARADRQHQAVHDNVMLPTVVPFVDGSLVTWLSDEHLSKALTRSTTQEESLLLLSVLAGRSVVRSNFETPVLRGSVEREFARLYGQWKAKLSEDQRRAAAKSSLYRYQGDHDLEGSQEELNDLFPTYEPGDEAAPILQDAQTNAHRIATLHRAIFRSSREGSKSIITLLEQLTNAYPAVNSPSEDAELLPTVIVALRRLVSSSAGVGQTKSSYNIYTDANVEQIRRLSVVLLNIRARFEQLHQVWPEHATPVEVSRLISQILAISHSQPLPRFLPPLEKLYATVTEWQKIASREFSVNERLEDLITLIAGWRRLELSSWNGLLDRETTNAESDASSWWFVAYETIIVASQDVREPEQLKKHAQGLVTTLESFMMNCGLGEYAARLELLRTFEAHLKISSADAATLDVIRQALSNFIAYYEHFEAPVRERLASGRSKLEKEIKNVIVVASRENHNVEVLRQSAKSSHKRLLRHVRKYRVLLAQPVAQVLQAGLPKEHLPLEVEAEGQGIASYVQDPTQFATSTPQVSILSHVWNDRPTRFVNMTTTSILMRSKTSQALKAFDAPGLISAFTSQLGSAIKELQKATPATFTERNKQAVQHLKSQKRRLLAETLKDARLMGFQASMSEDVLAQQASLSIVLASSPAVVPSAAVAGLKSAESSFHQLLCLMPTVRDGARKHSDDLTPAESARCVALLESMLHTSIRQRQILHRHLERFQELEAALQLFEGFASCPKAEIVEGKADQSSLAVRSRGLCLAIATCIDLIQIQSELGKIDCSACLRSLSKQKDILIQLEEEIKTWPLLPDGLCHEAESSLKIRLGIVESEVQELVISVIDGSPELEPVISHLTRWIENKTGPAIDALSNGHIVTEADPWIGSLLQGLDQVLTCVQAFGAPTDGDNTVRKGWLLQQTHNMDRQLGMLQLHGTSNTTQALLNSLRYVKPASDLEALREVCCSSLPIMVTYLEGARQILVKLCALYSQTNEMAFQLAQAFVQLAQQGFCSPPEKAESKDQQEGDVEAGTGLGEGEAEGAEDISKDIGDDEDLSELAQQPKADGAEDEIEDSKDAVDMADQEMEGQLGDQPDADSDEEGGDAGDDQSAADGEMDEEPGDVDELGPSALDEKMWDEGKDENLDEKEADGAKGSSKDQEMAAAEGEKGREEAADDDQEGLEDAQAGADEAENVERPEPEKMDPHVDEQQILDLPEDIEMDGQKADDADGSDSDAFPDQDAAEQQSEGVDADFEQDGNASADDAQSESGDLEDNNMAEEEAENGHGDGEPEQPDDDDQKSDILMREDEQESAARQQDDQIFGESGTGADESEAKAQQSQAAAEQAEDAEGEAGAEQDMDAGASGAQRGKRTEDNDAQIENTSDGSNRLPYKKIGDALDEWYKQQRNIDSAQEETQPESNNQKDIDMADAQFEHLLDDEAAADTQALGAASAEQSTALDEDKGLPVNDQESNDLPPANDQEDQPVEETQIGNEPRMEPSDTLKSEDKSSAFVGESQDPGADVDMQDSMPPPDENHVNDVDRQLTNTHLDQLDVEDLMTIEEARHLWSEHEASTRNLALVLTEHLRLILQPTQATKMRGDFRTGKRLNIKRIIPYIASSYKRDKIWMRRSVPSKRSYQIMLAIDDSKSMAEGQSRGLAFETLALVAKAMSMLEVGELGVVGFGEDVRMAHDFSTPFTSEAGAEVFRNFTFAQSKTNVRKLLAESIELFRAARLKAAGSASELWQLQLIISDGVCEDHPTICQLVRQAHEERIMVVFVVVDAAAQQAQAAEGPKQSILDLQTAEFVKDQAGEMQLKMVKYLDTFPFKYYLIVRDVQELPAVLAGALRQWFAEVVETGG